MSDRTNLTAHDFRVQDEGTIIVLHPCNDAARSWIDDNLYLCDGTPPQWFGGGVVIEHRVADNILDGLTQDGFTLTA